MSKFKLAVSIGDINGIGLEILLGAHKELCKFCKPFYFVHQGLLEKGAKKLNLKAKGLNLVHFQNSKDFSFKEDKSAKITHFASPLKFDVKTQFKINPGQICAQSGLYSFLSFEAASNFVHKGFAHALLTLPIHKKAWQEARIAYKGHTGALSEFFNQKAIMMLGCSKLFVGLFTEHTPLSEVSARIELKDLARFLIDFYENTHFKKIGILGFNPHASDFGTIGGKEEAVMKRALDLANAYFYLKRFEAKFKDENALFERLLKDEKLVTRTKAEPQFKEIYLSNILVADSAFTKDALKSCKRLVAMYHDLALAPLKALYFDKSINVSLNLPIIRTSVDHGTAFDKAYKGAKISTKSYIEAARMAVRLAKEAQSGLKNAPFAQGR